MFWTTTSPPTSSSDGNAARNTRRVSSRMIEPPTRASAGKAPRRDVSTGLARTTTSPSTRVRIRPVGEASVNAAGRTPVTASEPVILAHRDASGCAVASKLPSHVVAASEEGIAPTSQAKRSASETAARGGRDGPGGDADARRDETTSARTRATRREGREARTRARRAMACGEASRLGRFPRQDRRSSSFLASIPVNASQTVGRFFELPRGERAKARSRALAHRRPTTHDGAASRRLATRIALAPAAAGAFPTPPAALPAGFEPIEDGGAVNRRAKI